MTDNLSPADRRKTMRAVKGKGTKPERRLFAMLAGMRLKGWRRHAGDIPGKPDALFDFQRVAIFMDGCFWHSCPTCDRKLPDTNRSYWENKIRRNVERARTYDQRLHEEGWQVIRIWEHEIASLQDRRRIQKTIRKALTRDTGNHE